MKTKEIIGIKENLIFYYPPNTNILYAQRYNVETDDVVWEGVISSQYEYDITLSIFNMFNNPNSPANRKKMGIVL